MQLCVITHIGIVTLMLQMKKSSLMDIKYLVQHCPLPYTHKRARSSEHNEVNKVKAKNSKNPWEDNASPVPPL